MAGPVHYEIYIRRTPPDDWSLSQAMEDRRRAMETAEDLMRDRQAVAVRVTKETLDPETMEFASVVVLTRGAPELKRKRPAPVEPRGPACRGVQDLYAPMRARPSAASWKTGWVARARRPSSCCTGRIWPNGWKRRAWSCSTPSRRSPCLRPRPFPANRCTN